MGAVHQAIQVAARVTVVIWGASSTRSETAFEYIQTGSPRSAREDASSSSRLESKVTQCVLDFVENPSKAITEQYLQEGAYYWNLGMFVLKIGAWLNALELFRHDILQATQATEEARAIYWKFVRPRKLESTNILCTSVFYAVTETS